MSSSSVPSLLAAPPARASASPAHQAAQRVPIAPCWKAASARKRKESCEFESMWSKDASLGIRQDRETFSVRYRASAHKAPIKRLIALQATLLRRLFRPIRCMCGTPPSRENQTALTAYRGQGAQLQR